MKNRVLAAIAVLIGTAIAGLHAQNIDIRREVDKANKQTLPAAVRLIEENTDIKLTLAIDAESFGNDVHAWSNVYIIANRIVGALSEVGRDQVGKDAIERAIKKVVIVRIAPTLPDTVDPKGNPLPAEDSVELKSHTVYVRTTASDKAMTVLQNIIVAALEKALPTGHPPERAAN